MNNEKSYTYTIHQYFYVENQCGRKHHNPFSYMYLRITFIRRTKFLCSPAAIGRSLQPHIFLGYNQREDPTPLLYGYDQKEDTTPYVLQLQLEGVNNHLSFPCPTTLKYKCKIIDETTVTLSL
jgi:hypothetical protein